MCRAESTAGSVHSQTDAAAAGVPRNRKQPRVVEIYAYVHYTELVRSRWCSRVRSTEYETTVRDLGIVG